MDVSLNFSDGLKVKRQQDKFSPFTATRASCGLYHSLVVGKRGDVPQLYGWGRNHNNVLALGPDVSERTFPAQVGHFAKSHIYQVSCGVNHTVVIIKQHNQSGGKVYSCGLGNKGRLGFSKTTEEVETAETDAWFTPKPIRVRFPNKEKIARIACGSDHTLAITDAGELFSWGVGQYGNLGTGETSDEYRPIKIEIGGRDSFVIHCSAGGKHSLACTNDGRCFSWGHGGNGRLGLGHSRAALIPTIIDYLAGREICFVSAGESHSACIDKTGILYTWGAGGYGRLGHGEDSDLPVPRKVEEFGGVSMIQVACGTFHTMAVSRTGALYGWGAGLGLGLVSEGDNTSVLVPKQVREGGIGSTVCQVAVGTYHTIALTLTGDVFCWGVGGQSRLGHGDNVNQAYPKHIAELRNRAFVDDIKPWLIEPSTTENSVLSTAVGMTNEAWKVQKIRCGGSHTMILTASGDVWVWGSNKQGQLGLGDNQDEDILEPVLLKGFREPIKGIACGMNHSLAVNIRGDLFVWGDGSQGQLGLGRIVDAYSPTGVVNVSGVFDVAAGDDYSCCLVGQNFGNDGNVYGEAGDLWTWGSCEAGKLGHEGLSSGSCVAPKKVKLSVPISKMSCGRSHMIVCSPNGDVFTWGAGYYGRLGIGSSANSPIPVRVIFPDDTYIAEVAAGAFHCLALSNQGVLWAWGRDVSICSEDHVKTPAPFECLESTEGVPLCKTMACAGDHSLVVTQSGQVWGWGDNKRFQLGCGKKSSEFVSHPEVLITLPDACDIIATSENHTVAALRSGDVFAWGGNDSGCLGIGLKKAKFIPSPEPVVTHWISIEQRLTGTQTGRREGVLGTSNNINTVDQHRLNVGTNPRNSPQMSPNRIPDSSATIIPHQGEFAKIEQSDETRVIRFLDRLRFSSDTSTFATAQELLKSEPRACRAEELAFLENDLIKIFGRLLNLILKMPETEKDLRQLENQAEKKLARFIIHVNCDAPNTAAYEQSAIPEFYLSKLAGIQRLVCYLQTQPAYLVNLAIAIKRDYERHTLVSAVRQLLWNIDDRHINATFLGLCAAVCTNEIDTSPDLLRLFRPQDSNFIQLFSLYTTQIPNLIHYGRHLIDPSFEGGAGFALDNLKDLTLALTIEKLQELNPPAPRGEKDYLQTLFHRSLEGIQAVLSVLGPAIRFPIGICALIKHAYDSIVAREFSFDVSGGTTSQMQFYSYYPLVRLIIQGTIARVWKDPLQYERCLRCRPFKVTNSEVNFRTLWVFINSAFEDDFVNLKGGHLFREIFQMVYVKMVDLIVATINGTPDDHIRVELTLSLYLTHFNIIPQFVTLRSDIIATLINLLKDHEAHLQLSAFDPVTEVMKQISGGRAPVFTREMIEHLEANPYSHNVHVERRFLLKEKNAVFDATTGAPVPQRLALRQQAATREGRTVISLIQRYVPPDPLDPRAVVEEALRKVPPVTAKDWGALSKEFSILQEYFSCQDPPQYAEAQFAAKAAKYAADFESQDIPPVSGLKWIGEGLRKRQKHRAYLTMVQIGEDAVADAERHYQFELKRRIETLNEVVKLMKELYIEPTLRTKLEENKIRPKVDIIAQYCGREPDTGLESRPTVTIPLRFLFKSGVISHCSLDALTMSKVSITFTSLIGGGWSVQIVEVSKSGDRTLDQYDIPIDEMARLNDVPPSSDVAYGEK